MGIVYVPVVAATHSRGRDNRIIHLALPDRHFGFLPWETLCGMSPSRGLADPDGQMVRERPECSKCWRIMRKDPHASAGFGRIVR